MADTQCHKCGATLAHGGGTDKIGRVRAQLDAAEARAAEAEAKHAALAAGADRLLDENARLSAANRDLARRVSDLEDAVAAAEANGYTLGELAQNLATERAARERAEAACAAMREALESHTVELVGNARGDGVVSRCMICDGMHGEHAPSCALATDAGAPLLALARAAEAWEMAPNLSVEQERAAAVLRDAVAAWQRGGGR